MFQLPFLSCFQSHFFGKQELLFAFSVARGLGAVAHLAHTAQISM